LSRNIFTKAKTLGWEKVSNQFTELILKKLSINL